MEVERAYKLISSKFDIQHLTPEGTVKMSDFFDSIIPLVCSSKYERKELNTLALRIYGELPRESGDVFIKRLSEKSK